MKHGILFLFTIIFSLPAAAQSTKALTQLGKGLSAAAKVPQAANTLTRTAEQAARVAEQASKAAPAITTFQHLPQLSVRMPNAAITAINPLDPMLGASTGPTSPVAISQGISQEIQTLTYISQLMHIGMTGSIAKQILNQHTQFVKEYKKATALYEMIQNPSISTAKLRTEIENTIINNTLRNSLLQQLDNGQLSTMKQELEQYFLLSAHQPFFATSIAPRDAFAMATRGYLITHPHKPSWHLREIIKFGGMHQTMMQLSAQEKELAEAVTQTDKASLQILQFGGIHQTKQRLNISEEDFQKLLSMYSQAEKLNTTVKEYIAKSAHTAEENEAIFGTLQKMYDLYDELLTFAKNSPSVKNTMTVYNNLLADMEAFIAKHKRAPIWKNKEERPLYQLFEPLVFNNQINQFEEIEPVLNKLYELTEKYPVKRFSQEDTLKMVESFYKKHGFLPRSVKVRDFYDIRPEEALTLEAILYWQYNSTNFAQKVNALRIQEKDFYPQFY